MDKDGVEKENALKNFIKKNSLDCKSFAKHCRLSPTTIYGIYNGKIKPRRQTIKTICRFSEGRLKKEDFANEKGK